MAETSRGVDVEPLPVGESPESPALKTPTRLHRVAGLRLAGKSQYEIAAALGISQTTVHRDLAEIASGWKEGALIGVDQLRAVEYARMERVIALAMEGYARSRQDRQRVKTVTTRKGNRTETTTEGQAGNPGFLRVVAQCSERIAALMGADAPKQHELSGPEGGPITFMGLLAAAAKLPSPPLPEPDPEIEALEALMALPLDGQKDEGTATNESA